MQLINLTPHALVILTSQGLYVLPSRGEARVKAAPGPLEGTVTAPNDAQVPIYGPDVYGAVEGLPDPKDGVYYVVSALVGARCAHRQDVLVPGTGPDDGASRNERGQIVAVTRLKRPA
jgi:hypothetical protein